MPTKTLVLDTSVVVKWFVRDEPDDDRALELREGIERGLISAVMPSHAHVELAAGLVRATRRGRLTLQEAVEALDAFGQFEIGLISSESILDRSFALAASLGLSTQDAAFVAASDLLNVPLVTADLRLIAKAGAAGHRLMPLADFEPPDGT